MRLNEIQERFKDNILQPLSTLKNPEEKFKNLFECGNISFPDRLAIYHNNVLGGITINLYNTFPILQKLVGEDFLKSMTRIFVMKNPPKQGCLSLYGIGFDDFIAAFPQTQNMPYLADIARLELAINAAYYAPDDSPLMPEHLQAIDKDFLADTMLNLRTSAFLIKSPFPLENIRKLCLEQTDESPDMNSDHKTRLLVLRPALTVQIFSLEEDEYKMLENMTKHMTLGQSLDDTLEFFPKFRTDAFLQKHLALETFKT